jgi:hypothetical protein
VPYRVAYTEATIRDLIAFHHGLGHHRNSSVSGHRTFAAQCPDRFTRNSVGFPVHCDVGHRPPNMIDFRAWRLIWFAVVWP